MAQWEARLGIFPENIGDTGRQFLTLNTLYDTKEADFIDDQVHPMFYKGLSPIYVRAELFGRDRFRGMYGFYCYYDSKDGLARGQSGFNPPNAQPDSHNSGPTEIDWASDDELKNYCKIGHGDGSDLRPLTPVKTLDSFASSYLGMVIAAGYGTWYIWYRGLHFYKKTFDRSWPSTAILKASGYGSYENLPKTSFEDVKGGDKTKTEWKSFSYDSEPPIGLPVFSEHLAKKLNDDHELSGLHPLQMKIVIFLLPDENQYTAVVFHTDAYASTAPQNFIVQEGDDKNNMLLPYSPYYKNGKGDFFKRWCWIQQSHKIKDAKEEGRQRNHAFKGENSLIAALEKLPPAQQFLAQVSGTQINESRFFYLNFPLAYYEGYKLVKDDELALDKRAANKSDQQFIFLNLTVDDIEVYVTNSSAEADDDKVDDTAICIRDTYLTKGYFHKGPNNSTFKVTKKGDSDTVIGQYQAVDTPDLHDYYITIIIEPK